MADIRPIRNFWPWIDLSMSEVSEIPTKKILRSVRGLETLILKKVDPPPKPPCFGGGLEFMMPNFTVHSWHA